MDNVGKLIGRGSFADVYEYTGPNNEEWACKVLSEWKDETEVQVHYALQPHKRIVTLHDHFQRDGKAFLILDRCDGSVHSFLCKYKPNFLYARMIARQLAEALVHLKKNKVIHRDITTSNVFLYYRYVKLGDFGTAVISSESLTEVIGSFESRSPEMLSNKPYSFETDVWGAGVVLYTLFTSKKPFQNEYETVHKELEFPKDLNPYVKDLLVRMLDKDPNRRIKAEDIGKHDLFCKKY